MRDSYPNMYAILTSASLLSDSHALVAAQSILIPLVTQMLYFAHIVCVTSTFDHATALARTAFDVASQAAEVLVEVLAALSSFPRVVTHCRRYEVFTHGLYKENRNVTFGLLSRQSSAAVQGAAPLTGSTEIAGTLALLKHTETVAISGAATLAFPTQAIRLSGVIRAAQAFAVIWTHAFVAIQNITFDAATCFALGKSKATRLGAKEETLASFSTRRALGLILR